MPVVLPNLASVILVQSSLLLSAAILVEASLSFLGLGDPNLMSWGYMVGAGRTRLLADFHAVLARMHVGRSDGELLAEEPFGWFAAPGWQHRAGEPLPLATLAEPCGVRAMAGQALDAAGMAWAEVFVGGGVAAVAAAVMAGLGVAALAPRMLPLGAVDVGARLGLPALPRLPVLLHTRTQDGRPRDALTALSAAFRSAVRG